MFEGYYQVTHNNVASQGAKSTKGGSKSGLGTRTSDLGRLKLRPDYRSDPAARSEQQASNTHELPCLSQRESLSHLPSPPDVGCCALGFMLLMPYLTLCFSNRAEASLPSPPEPAACERKDAPLTHRRPNSHTDTQRYLLTTHELLSLTRHEHRPQYTAAISCHHLCTFTVTQATAATAVAGVFQLN